MNKSKVLFLLHQPPPVHGSSMVGQFIKESDIINKDLEGIYINLLASKNVKDTGKVSVAKIIGFVNIYWQLLKILVNNKPVLCYFAITATGFAFFRDVLLIVLLKMFKVKRVYHMHNKGVNKYNGSLIYSVLYRFIFKNAEVILLSKLLYVDIEKYVKKSNLHICANGIPEIEMIKDKVSNKKTKLLFLSNLIESKGVYKLLEACKVLKQSNINFECNFIGGESDITKHALVKRIKEYRLQENVHYLGKKYGAEKHKYFNEADIFVFPTFYSNECFPLVLIEALQYSIPVISTFEGGIPDLIEEGVTGFLIPQKDVNSLVEKLKVLIDNPVLRIQMGIAGQKKYQKEFTLRKFEENLASILNQIIVKN